MIVEPAREPRTVRINIDHRDLPCPEGASVLRAAELNGIRIPALCSHKDLSPFGGCRLCMVEIEGMRGYPLACSTIVQEGMKVLTETVAIREMRREILALLLSEHPASCLFCSESEECRENQITIRKAGVTTGCRYCPKDGQCELQGLAQTLGVAEAGYPIDYRGYEPEQDDPFFDRDYNLCILCGRCVRMCQEVRGASVLAFQHRGPRTRIGPAFGRNHVEAGCEFCGACVSVCPTGTLAEKVSKWDGMPDGSRVSTCPFCGLGCQITLQHKGGRLSKVDAHLDPEINDGQLCLRGRFCLPETTHHHERARKPVLKRGAYHREVSWPEALSEVAARLAGTAPGDFLMLVSPDLTNESLFAARQFVRSVMRSDGIDSSVRLCLPGGAELWRRLFSLPISIREVGRADAVITVGIDTRFSFSVVGVEIRRALRSGAALVAIDSRESNLARYTDHRLRTAPGQEGMVFRRLVETLIDGRTGPDRPGGSPDAARMPEPAGFVRACELLSAARHVAAVIGPSVFAADSDGETGAALLRLAEREGTTVLPLYHGANSRGALELGLLDGGRSSWLTTGEFGTTPKVLYLVGEAPFVARPDCEFIIAQDLYRPCFEVDAFLPASSFAEAEGTLTNIEGRVQEVAAVESLPDGALTGFMRPDWFIFAALAEEFSKAGRVEVAGDGGRAPLLYRSAADIRAAISRQCPGFPSEPDRRRRRLTAGAGPFTPAVPGPSAPAEPRGSAPPSDARQRQIVQPGAFRYRGIDLTAVVEGLAVLGRERLEGREAPGEEPGAETPREPVRETAGAAPRSSRPTGENQAAPLREG